MPTVTLFDMKNLFFLIFAVVFVQKTAAQQPSAPRRDSLEYDLHLSATALFSGGNLARVVSQNRLWGSVGKRRVQFVTENSYRFGKNGSRVVEDDILSRNYLRLFVKKRWYVYALGWFEANYRRSIEGRWQLGGGVAYNFYEKPNRDFLRISLSAVQENARFRVGTYNLPGFEGQENVQEPRAMFRFGGVHSILAKHLVLRHDTWFMAGLKHRENYRWHTLLTLQVPVYHGFSFKADYDYTYENLTIRENNPFGTPSSQDDWVLSFGVTYDLNSNKK
jgi:Protein of unknown function, DUF481